MEEYIYMNVNFGKNVSRCNFIEITRGDTFVLNGKQYLAHGKPVYVDAEQQSILCFSLSAELPDGETRELKVTDFPIDRDAEISSCLEYLAYNNWRKTKEGPGMVHDTRDYLTVLFNKNSSQEDLQKAWKEYHQWVI